MIPSTLALLCNTHRMCPRMTLTPEAYVAGSSVNLLMHISHQGGFEINTRLGLSMRLYVLKEHSETHWLYTTVATWVVLRFSVMTVKEHLLE